MCLEQRFFDFVISHVDSSYALHTHLDTSSPSIEIQSSCILGSVTLNSFDTYRILELKIENTLKEKTTFYLHFELKELQRAEDLFLEMMESFHEQISRKAVSVLLCCTSGITTSYFASKLNEAGVVLNLDYSFDAVPYTDFFAKVYQYDVVLLAPQIAYTYEKIRTMFPKILVLCIPTSAFAAYDASAVLLQLQKELHKREEQEETRKLPLERQVLKSLSSTLVVCIQVQEASVRIGCRIYAYGKILYDATILKDIYRLRDLEDAIDVAMVQYPDIERICVVTPGVISHGHLTFRSADILDEDIYSLFKDRYHRPLSFLNDANAMALGYYTGQHTYSNICFYFHPIATRTSGIGYVVDGKLMKGRNNLCGEMQYVAKTLKLDRDTSEKYLSPQGALELVNKYLVGVIAHVDPEVIVVYCNLIPDLNELRKELEKTIQPAFIPDLVRATECMEYMFLGGLMDVAQCREDSVEKYNKSK